MDNKLVGIIIIFFLVFGLFTSILIFQKPIIRLTKAKEEYTPSAAKTLIFVWPLNLTADGKKAATINIFVRNEKGVPVVNKKVSLNTNLGTVKEIQSISDQQGKTEFNLTSDQEGVAKIKAIINGNIETTQAVSIQFTK
jgi:hypothetical protein